MIKDYKILRICRLCNGKIKKIINFGNIALGNNLEINIDKAKKNKKIPFINL